MSNDEDFGPPPLPREWLPERLPPEEDAVWDERVARIMAVAPLEGGGVQGRSGPDQTSWLSEMGRWWRRAAALGAAAVVALIFVVEEPERTRSSAVPAEALALTVVATDGDPVALWAALGVAADPLLALLALENHDAIGAPSGPSTPSGRESR